MPHLSIVHLTTYLQGGAGRAITDLACAQRAAGHRVLAMASSTGVPGYENYPHYLERLRRSEVEVILEDSLFTREVALNLRALARLRAARSSARVDIVHAHAGTPARVGLAFARDCRDGAVVIQTQHGWGSIKTERQAREDLEVLQQVARVVVTSEATLTQLVEFGVPSDRMLTIPCGIAPFAGRTPHAVATALAPLRQRGLSIVGCVGTVNANKNQRLVLDALVRMEGGKVAAVFVGEGGESLQRGAEEKGLADRVLAVGYQPDADRWMNAFDALVVPSFTEGQGLVVMEAFRARLPVLASAIPSLRSMVVPEHTGWLFDPHDPVDLARLIDRVLRLSPAERADVTECAHASFRAQCTVGQMVSRHEQLYQQLRAA